MSEKIFLGLDTSNYTTSLAILGEDGRLLANLKKLLPVKQGERGLRQSDAVFAHVKNLPALFEMAESIIADNEISVVGVSDKPRRLEVSYMPCFLAGVNVATGISVSCGVPLKKFSHQCGHIMAAIYSSGNFGLLTRDFAAFHISGGTTELLHVHPQIGGFKAAHIGGTRDLNAGQVIDRVGVAMGCSFPAGRELEALALENSVKIPKRKISRDGLWINLSGVENMAADLFSKTSDKALVSAFVLDYIGNCIAELSEAYMEKYGETHFVYAGGVMSNSIIKEMLSKRFSCSFAEPAMSADNAVGIAYLAYLASKNDSSGEDNGYILP